MITQTWAEARRGLASHQEAERIWAAEDLAASGAPEAVTWLRERLALERSRAVQEALVAALGPFGQEGAEALVALLDSPEAFLRNRAVLMLRSQGRTSWPALARAFRSASAGVRKLVLDALAVRPGEEAAIAEEIFAAALEDPDPNVVIAAVEALGRAGRTGFRRRLEQLAAGASPMLAAACLEALLLAGDRRSLAALRDTVRLEGLLLPFWLPLVARFGGRADLDAGAWAALEQPASLQEAVLETIGEVLARDPGPLPAALGECLSELANRAATAPLRSLAAALAAGSGPA